MIESITFEQFQHGIAPLWHTDDPSSIPIYNNPYRIIQYSRNDQPHRMLVRCVRYIEDGEIKGYSSIYNISDAILRIRGIYVLPEHRSKGVGHRIWREMVDLFPASFYRVVGFWRESSYARFIEHSKMQIVPGTGWIWSEFSQTEMKMLYWDRGPKPDDLFANRAFIDANLPEFGMGGTANLNVHWTDAKWADYIAIHEGSYPDLNVNLDF